MGNQFMTIRFAAAAIGVLVSGSAFAADIMPVYKAPPRAAAVVSVDWTGFYVGGNVGGVWSRSTIDYTASTFFTASSQISADGSPRLNDSSIMGGVQAGANWQTGAFVLGIEADINSVRVRHSSTVTQATAPGLSLGYTVSESVASNWLFTFRGRGGMTFGNALLYVTGGLAVADNKFTQSSFFPNCPCGVSGEASGAKVGWTIGAGIEYAVAPAWSLKAEYLYVDLGKQTFADNLAAFGFPQASFTHEEHLRESIARVGLNYRFGGPIVARF
jgi:outer membrane immunogenic protein